MDLADVVAPYVLIFLASTEVVVSQVSYLLPVQQFGPLSLLKCYRGAVWLMLLALILLGRPARAKQWREIQWLYIFGHISMAIWIVNGFSRAGGIAGFGTFFKISYWLSWWLCLCLYIRRSKYASLLLRGLVLGGVAMCVFVYWGYISGTGFIEAYEHQADASLGVKGSSPKNVPAYLAVAGLLAAHLWRQRLALGILMACFLLGGMMLTYRRSAQVGLALAVLWLIYWRIFLCWRRRDARLVLNLFGALGLAGLIFVAYVGWSGLEARWASAAGGGERVRYWVTTLDFILHKATLREVFAGTGAQQMLASMFEAGHGAISTHSDPCNLVFLGGVTGLVFYAFLCYVLWHLFRRVNAHTLEAAMFGCTLCVFLPMSLLSAQFSAVNAMFIYIGAWICLPIIANRADAPAPRVLRRK